jgi:Na+-driven multidrug efflux pump
MKLGVSALAGYQLCINIFLFFGLFGEPFSQLSQTQLPAIIDRDDGPKVRSTFQSILTLGTITSLVIGAVTYGVTFFGPGLISSDIAVQQVARNAAPALALNVASGIIANAVDGAFLASKDFGFLTGIGATLLLLQLSLLPTCTSIGAIFGTFTIRLAVYTVIALGRIALGHGAMGRVFWLGYKNAVGNNDVNKQPS